MLEGVLGIITELPFVNQLDAWARITMWRIKYRNAQGFQVMVNINAYLIILYTYSTEQY